MIKDFLRKVSEPSLDPQTANRLLKDVFEICEREPNRIPTEVLISYQNYRRERYALQKHVLNIVLLLFFLLPLLFILPVFSLTPDADAAPGRPVYHIDVNTFLPITRVTASIDGYNIAVYETGRHTYSIEPTRNGTMTVTVTLANNQYAARHISVDGVDRRAPQLDASLQKDGLLFLYLSDEDSGIYYEGIHAVNTDNEPVRPLSFDPDTGCVEFLRPESTLNIYIPDYSGNQLHLVVSVP